MATGSTLSKTLIWALMAMLVVGLGGFGVTNFGGHAQSIGRVGETDIPLDQYTRALRGEMDALAAQTGTTVNFQQAQAMGADQRALAQVIISTTLDNEASAMGLSVGDETLAEQIVDIPAFQGSNGTFDRDAYRFALDRADLSEAEFENRLRVESARSFVQNAVAGGATAPDGYVDTVLNFVGQGRDVTYAILTDADLSAPLRAPNDADLQAYYDENIESFTLPERKLIAYAILTPDMLIDTVEVDTDALQQAYEERSAEFNTPERRLVERLVFPTAEAAAEARARLDAGSATFEDLVSDRGLDLADIDLGDVTKTNLGAAGAAVFDATPPQVVGPVDSDLGPALFRINAVLPGTSKSFAEAEPALRDALATDRARRAIEQRAEDINDLLAAGATLEELAVETDMRPGALTWYAGFAEGDAAYVAFREAATALSADDFPEIITLDDGGIVAMRLEGTMEPSPEPYDAARDTVRTAWTQAETARQLAETAETLRAALLAGDDTALEGITLQNRADLRRSDFIDQAPADFTLRVFEMEANSAEVITGAATVALVRLNAIADPDLDSTEFAQMRQILKQQADAQMAQDVFNAYTNALRATVGFELDRATINLVHAQFN